MTDPSEMPAEPIVAPIALSMAVASAGNHRPCNEDVVGVAGWVLYGDTPQPVRLQLGFPPDAALGPASIRIVLADGMGGLPGGDLAARHAVQLLVRTDHGPSRRPLSAVFEQVDDQVRAAVGALTPGAGCTVAVLELDRTGLARVGNVGDVRVYRVTDGYLGQLTRDDRPPAGGNATSGQVTQCLGGRQRTVLEAHEFTLSVRGGDRFVLTTDGLHDALRAELLVAAVTGPPGETAARLVQDAVAAGATDNLTAVVIDVRSSRSEGSGAAARPAGS